MYSALYSKHDNGGKRINVDIGLYQQRRVENAKWIYVLVAHTIQMGEYKPFH